MTFSLSLLFAISVGYLLLLFLLAYAAEQEWIARQWVSHPSVYLLALGVYCSGWAFFGTTGLAFEYGYGYLSYYLGVSATFLLYPYILRPILRITRTYELGSLADLFSFRYRSRWAGTLTTVFMLLAVLPLIALQIQAITDATLLLNQGTTPGPLGFAFCIILIAFTILYGARHISPRERHTSLIFAIAFESLFKLIAFLILGYYAVFHVFGGLDALEEWLQTGPVTVTELQGPLPFSSWLILMLMFMAAPLTMPHMFQTLFRENRKPQHLKWATWALPVYVLLMALPVLPILWAGMELNHPTNPEYFSIGLGLGMDSPVITLLAYLGGLSAATGIVIVGTLALASMSLNHVILPFYQPSADEDIYGWLLWVRRFLIAVIILAGYLVYLLLGQVHNLSSLGIAGFVGALQFVPGILGVLYWNGANRKGFIAGVSVGMLIWFFSVLYPLISDSFSLSYRLPLQFALDEGAWTIATVLSFSLNMVVFILVSLITHTSREELNAADACNQNSLTSSKRRQLVAKNTEEFVESLSRALGKVSAEQEVQRALKELSLPIGEYRPYALRRLRDRIETNLSGLMGPSVAQNLVQRCLPFATDPDSAGRRDINFIERRLEGFHSQLTGLAAELDGLRRYHRQTLESLPIGVCSLGSDGEILMWNQVMTEVTGVDAEEVIGSHLDSLPGGWRRMLDDFLTGHSTHAYKKELRADVPVTGARTARLQSRWFNLHKASLPMNDRSLVEGTVILVEDQTDIQLLEDELVHSERLASIGSLAAGVAHEIGNPVTGIDCLAQDLLYDSQDEQVHEVAKQIREQTQRVTRIVQSLVNFAHGGTADGTVQHTPHPLRDVVQEAINLLELSRKSQDVHFHNRIPQELMVTCDPQRLAQVFINLLNNARDASPVGEAIVIQPKSTDEPQQLILEVVDRGMGIPPENLDRIFEPFFTTKDVGKGTGLGLWLAYSIVEEHFGQLTFESPAFQLEGIGTRVIITLPRFTEQLESTGVSV